MKQQLNGRLRAGLAQFKESQGFLLICRSRNLGRCRSCGQVAPPDTVSFLYHRQPQDIPARATVDSYGLYPTITTLHEGTDYQLRPNVSRFRDSFAAKEISVHQWILGPQDIADALTKVNPATFQILSDFLSTVELTEGLLSKSQRSMGYKTL